MDKDNHNIQSITDDDDLINNVQSSVSDALFVHAFPAHKSDSSPLFPASKAAAVVAAAAAES